MRTFHVSHNDEWTDRHVRSLTQPEGDALPRLRTTIFHALSDLDGRKSIRRALAGS